ncbi:hypothetical protein EDB19DRAFT_1906443 [Suillus lakei]|nr:hypothetical protein EDB19DRAFT_1906443 [Suillus lakei]
MAHHRDMKHQNIDDALKAEIGFLLVRDLPWCNNCLIDSADSFIPPTQCDVVIRRWARLGGALAENKGVYQWTAISKVPMPLQRNNWLELVSTPVDKTYESLLTIFFNEVTILSRKHKNHFKGGSAILEDVGLHLWLAQSRTLLEDTRSPDIILTASNSEAKWSELISVIKVKWKDSPDLLMKAILQLGDKATFVFHHQPHHQWFPCLSLCGMALHMSVFTHGRSLYSQVLDIGLDPRMFSKVMNYFTEADLSWLGYDVHIFRALHTTVQVWDDKRYWLNEEVDEAAYNDSEFHLVGHLHRLIGLHGKGTRVFAVESALNKQPLVIKDCWDSTGMVSNHVIHRKLQDPLWDSLVRSLNDEWVFTRVEDPSDRLDRECAQRLDGVYCHVGSRYWDNIRSLPGITIMKDHMRPSIGLFSETPVPQTVTSICAAMMTSQDLANALNILQEKI